ncbi:MAG: ATP-dependent RecD-like DNA helicase [Clostridia bacterium]|nr:ATP-dependent RecD-like DNA helicase [Clostridia bacterium]
MEIKNGTLVELIFHNEENSYTIGIFETAEEYFTVVGNLPNARQGMSYELEGDFYHHPKYGEQFKFEKASPVMPKDVEGIRSFLASGLISGVGDKTAMAITKAFGEDSLDVILNHKERLLELEGIGLKTMEKIHESYKAHKEYGDIALYFLNFDISSAEAYRLYKVYGSETINIVEENPYIIIEDVPGIGFVKADRIAQKLGLDRESDERISSGIIYTLYYYADEGNCYLPFAELCENVANLLELSRERVAENIHGLAFEGKLRIDKIDGVDAVYLFPLFQGEQRIAMNLKCLSESDNHRMAFDVDGVIALCESESNIQLSDVQKNAVKNALLGNVSVITGGPGTGKTTIINFIIKILERQGMKVAVAAPTGRAAKRIAETSDHYASTIHRLLEYYYDEEIDSMIFAKNSENQLDYDAVIVDEASMIDCFLMDGLLSAIKPGTKFIMVGDVNQLPSVGPGSVLKDIIDSEYVYINKLDEIYRQAKESLIIVNASRINKGEEPFYNERDKDFFIVRENRENEILNKILTLVSKGLKDKYEKDPLQDMQIITPVKRGTLGTYNLNVSLQEKLNPPAEDKKEYKFGDRIYRVGDKVMQTTNDYSLGWRDLRSFEEGEGIFNGDIGFISDIDLEDKTIEVVFDDKLAIYDNSNLKNLELAYAITVHKSQGSEFPVVIMPISYFPPILANRNLIYTAITRAKELLVLVGTDDKVKAMVDNNRIKTRYSGLKYRLVRFFEEDY